MAARLKAAGFPDSDIFVGGAIPRKANLVVRYHGTGAASPSSARPPRRGRGPARGLDRRPLHPARKGRLLLRPRHRGRSRRRTPSGRHPAALQARRLPPGPRPDLALTADEEGGDTYNGVDWLLKNHRDLIDAEFCINEGGGGAPGDGKRVCDSACRPARRSTSDYSLEVTQPGRTQLAPGDQDNAIYHLAAALSPPRHVRFPGPPERDHPRLLPRRWRQIETRARLAPTSPASPKDPPTPMRQRLAAVPAASTR